MSLSSGLAGNGISGGGGGGGSFGTPALTLTTTNVAGVATTGVRTDASILVFDATAPTTSAVGDAAAVGSATVTARRDHLHGRESFATNALLLGPAAAAGAATTPLRSNDTIAAFDATVPVTQAFADVAATGSVAFAARRDHKHGMPASPAAFVPSQYLQPSASLYETYPRWSITGSFTTVSGVLRMAAIALPSNLTIGHLVFMGGATAASGQTHWWFGLYDNNLVQLATTADQTSGAWNTNAVNTLAIATIASGASTTFTTTYSGLHYLGFMMAATTVPSLNGQAGGGVVQALGLATALVGTSDTGQTTPPAFPHTATALTTSQANYLYGYVAT